MLGHIPVAYFTTYYVMKKNNLLWQWQWLALGIFSAVLPDLDFFYQIFTNELYLSHRYLITHLPFFYLIALVILIIISCFYRKKWFKYAIIIVFVNIFVHLLVDTMFYGIRWLWPFSKDLIGVYNINGSGGIIVANYFHHWYWYLEIFLWPIAIIHLISANKKRFKQSNK